MKHDLPQNDNAIRLTSLNDIKTFSDPYRMMIYKTFSNAEEAITIKRVADIMGEVPAKVYYHAKKLIKLGVLELDHEENINGIIAKYYKSTDRRIIMSHDSLDEKHIPSMLTETQKMISNVIDDAKSEFIDAMQHLSQKEQKDQEMDEGDGGLIVSRIYLTKEEVKDLYSYLLEMSEKKKNEKKDDASKHLFFTGLIEVPQENEDN
tara:strand:- start:177 stop:794 length:618 start_codon:yes stop_codon:yes gene_type:complete